MKKSFPFLMMLIFGWIGFIEAQPSSQDHWKWCKKCYGLFYAADAPQGICPVDKKGHESVVCRGYRLHIHSEPFENKQVGWRYCYKCRGLFYSPGNTPQGVCPLDGQKHDPSESGNYTLCIGNTKFEHPQSGWRYCHKCWGLFYSPGKTPNGSCPTGGSHDPSQSGDYILEILPPFWTITIYGHAGDGNFKILAEERVESMEPPIQRAEEMKRFYEHVFYQVYYRISGPYMQ